MIDQAVALGVGVGVFAAAIQHLHVIRSIRGQVEKPSSSPMGKPMLGSLARLSALVVVFVVAGTTDRVSMSAAILAFAAAHLIGMLVLGARIAGGAFEKPKTSDN
jgi:hypothetical protein